MRDVEYERGCLSQCKCCCSIAGNFDGVSELCEPCLQMMKQCPPKKRFMRTTTGCSSSSSSAIRPRPVIVKPPTSSGACIALDRLVEVALSPTGSSWHSTTSSQTSSPRDDDAVDLAGHGPETPGSSSAAENGVLPRSSDGTAEGSITRMSSHTCKKKSLKQQVPMAPPGPPSKLPRCSLPLEAVQKLKRLSSLDPLPAHHRGAASKLGHGDHSKRFTPRFKSLLDISC